MNSEDLPLQFEKHFKKMNKESYNLMFYDGIIIALWVLLIGYGLDIIGDYFYRVLLRL